MMQLTIFSRFLGLLRTLLILSLQVSELGLSTASDIRENVVFVEEVLDCEVFLFEEIIEWRVESTAEVGPESAETETGVKKGNT